MMARYVWRDGSWINKRDGMPLLNQGDRAAPIAAPMVMRDIPEYSSPITGEMITSRSHRREDLIKHDCYEIDPPRKKRGFKNPRFAKKHKLALTEDGPIKDVEKERETLKARAIQGV